MSGNDDNITRVELRSMFSCTPISTMLVVVGFVALAISADVSRENPSGLRGTVTDRINHIPLSNVYIVAHRNGAPDLNARTDKQGKYAIALPVGIYDAFISTDHYSPTCRKVQVEADGMMVFDAALDPDALGMEKD